MHLLLMPRNFLPCVGWFAAAADGAKSDNRKPPPSYELLTAIELRG